MRRRWVLAAALALVVPLTIGGVSLAANGEGDHGITKQTTLRLLSVEDKFEFIDLGRKATAEEDISPGDMFVSEDVIRNRANTKTLGRLYAVCTALISPAFHCRGTVDLAAGTIEFSGRIDFAAIGRGNQFVPVVGGTERYENVVGEFKLHEEVAPGALKFSIELIPSFRRP
jgi:hypothetical protein